MDGARIAIGADHGGYELKEEIVKYLKSHNIEYQDFGTYSSESCDYPEFAKKVAQAVASGNFNKGILVCGSGIGVSIVANKVKGIRAALCWNLSTAQSARAHNDSNIVCLPQRQIEIDLGIQIVETWLNSEFEGGRHKRRVDMIEQG